MWFLVVPLLPFGQSATVQTPAQDREPRCVLALDSRLRPVDIDRTPLLGRRPSPSLDGATIKEALGEIGRQSVLRLAYDDDLLAATPTPAEYALLVADGFFVLSWIHHRIT